jgi:copper chaperone CopZ
VREVKVDFYAGKAQVQYEEGRVGVEQMIEALQKAGYRARLHGR